MIQLLMGGFVYVQFVGNAAPSRGVQMTSRAKTLGRKENKVLDDLTGSQFKQDLESNVLRPFIYWVRYRWQEIDTYSALQSTQKLRSHFDCSNDIAIP